MLDEKTEERRLTGIETHFVMQQNKKLRCGYTTGSCAAAAAKAATEMLLGGKICDGSDLLTPAGIRLHLWTEDQKIEQNSASCAVRKDGGDDPDATNGILIYAKAEKLTEENLAEALELSQDRSFQREGLKKGTPFVVIDGGTGVGRVTKPGLEQPVGAAAINRVPRQMIRQEVLSICEYHEYHGGIKITVFVPRGEEVGKKTFNPHLGIRGGISILGTSGIVVPMSEAALVESIRVEMRQKHAAGEEYLLITPGNYGADFLKSKELALQLRAEDSMKCSNYVGETLDMAVELGLKGILFVAHIGKFIKVSGGIMNTHSHHADCRAELMAAQAMRAGADADTVQRILATNTTEESVAILKEKGITDEVMGVTARWVRKYLQRRCRGELQTEVILYSNQFGYLGETEGAQALAQAVIKEKQRLYSQNIENTGI